VVLSDEYINAHSELELCCPKGHMFNLSWNNWTKGRRCKYCNKSIYFYDVKRSMEEEGYTLVSNSYINSKTKLEVVCPKGHKYFISWSKWLSGTRCKQCFVDSVKTKFEFVKTILLDKGYKLLI